MCISLRTICSLETTPIRLLRNGLGTLLYQSCSHRVYSLLIAFLQNNFSIAVFPDPPFFGEGLGSQTKQYAH